MIKLGNKVMVSDPCYGLETWCQGVIKNVLPGNYKCKVEYRDEGKWGKRVSAIQVTHENYDEDENCRQIDYENFEVGVDSGQAGIFDYEYYAQYHTHCSEYEHVDNNWYDKICNITLHNDQAGETDGLGFVSSSGYGDGGYVCFTERESNGYVIAIRIVFIDEEDEEYEN